MTDITKETTRVDWTDENRHHFVQAMVNEASKGNFVDNGFKKQSWQAIQNEFNSASGCRYDKQQLHSHYAVLKKRYHIYKMLKDNSGFGVDPSSGAPTAPSEVWAAYIKAHPDAAQFRYKAFTPFDDLDSIFTGKVASGKYARSSTATPQSAELQSKKRVRGNSVDESWLSVTEKQNDHDDDYSSDDSSRENKIPNRDAARDDEKKNDGVKPMPIRAPRAKPGSDLTNILGKIVANQDKIVAHNMSDSKLDQALKIFSAEYSANLIVTDRLKFKKVLSAQPATAEMFLQLDEEEKEAFIQEIIL